MAEVDERNNELKSKQICRCCMNQDVSLTNIYSRENRLKSTVPLPLQIMACVSIEVFTNDGMPSTICDSCRMLMDHSYRFKQMCKKADTMLKQYPLTGVWPKALELPRIPLELIKKQQKETSSQPASPMLKRPASGPAAATPQMKRLREGLTPKILNKNSPKLLNKSVRASPAPVMSAPIIKTDDSGNVEIITELLENVEGYEDVDPIKFAPPVETNVFPCPRCERSFPLRQLLEIHMTNHSRERSFGCNVCDKKFFSKYDLGKHSLIHSGEKPYQCVVCKKTFSRSTLLHRHEKVHTDQPRYLCVYCDRPFLSRTELDKHSETHKKSRPFACSLCNKSFAFKQGLERHEVVHLKEQPYPCEYCDQSFPTPSKLARHLTAHAGERPYPCKMCPKSFLLSHHLSRHLRSHAAGAGSYKCSDCEIVFSSKDDLIYHSAVHATQNLTCPLCKEQFNDLDSVTEHIKSHSVGEQYACDYCDLIFSNAEKLDEHCSSLHIADGYLEDGSQSRQVVIKKEMKDGDETDSDDEEEEEDRQDHDEEEQMEHTEEMTEIDTEEQIDEYVVEEVEEEGPDGGEKKISVKTLQVMKSRPMNATKQYGSKRSVSPPKTKAIENSNKQSLITKYTKKINTSPQTQSHNSSLEQRSSPVESVKRPLRNNKIKDYAKLIKTELKYDEENEDEDQDEEQEEEATASDGDEDYVAEEEDEEETTKKSSNSRVYKSKQPQRYSNEKASPKEKPNTSSVAARRSGNENRSSDQTKEKLSIQDKVSQFIKINDSNANKAAPKVIKRENPTSVEKVLKSLPKGVTVSKKDNASNKTSVSSAETHSSNAAKKPVNSPSNNDSKASSQNTKIVKKEPISPSNQKKLPLTTTANNKKPNNSPAANTKTYSMKKPAAKPDTPEAGKKSNNEEKTKTSTKNVQKVILTKAEVEKMTKEGKITIQEDGTMILLTTHGKKGSSGDSSKSSSAEKK